MEDIKRNLLVIKASAGSGKTYTLAKEYIKHLLFSTSEDGTGRIVPRRHQGDTRPLNAHRLLLAITFTNKFSTTYHTITAAPLKSANSQ